MTMEDLATMVSAYSAKLAIDPDGDLVIDQNGGDVPPSVLELIRQHRDALKEHIATSGTAEPDWDLNDPVVRRAIALFDGRVGIADIVQPWPAGKTPDPESVHRAWLTIAVRILNRNFAAQPVDRSTVEAWRIGLKGYPDPLIQFALSRLETVKPAAWGKRDLKAGTLLPRPR